MSTLEDLGSLIFVTSPILGIIILLISGWELRHGDKKLSRKKFVKTTWLLGITTAVSGAGFLLILASSWRPGENIIQIFLSVVGWIGVYPAIIMGGYILHMKSHGYVETDDQGND